MTDQSVISGQPPPPQVTAPPRRRARRKEARPGEIIEAALRLFADRGYAATKLEDVAAAAGIGKGTIYLYFPPRRICSAPSSARPCCPTWPRRGPVAGPRHSAADILRAIAERFLLLLDTDLTAIPKLVVAESGNFPASPGSTPRRSSSRAWR